MCSEYLHSTCPNHLNLSLLIIMPTDSNHNSPLSSARLFFLSVSTHIIHPLVRSRLRLSPNDCPSIHISIHTPNHIFPKFITCRRRAKIWAKYNFQVKWYFTSKLQNVPIPRILVGQLSRVLNYESTGMLLQPRDDLSSIRSNLPHTVLSNLAETATSRDVFWFCYVTFQFRINNI